MTFLGYSTFLVFSFFLTNHDVTSKSKTCQSNMRVQYAGQKEKWKGSEGSLACYRQLGYWPCLPCLPAWRSNALLVLFPFLFFAFWRNLPRLAVGD